MQGINLEPLENLRPEEYQELLADSLKLAGIWEESDKGEELYRQQKQQAESNLAAAKSIQNQVAANTQLRKDVAKAINSLEIKHQEWLKAEAEMHSALEPMSRLGIKRRMQQLYNESEDLCEALEQSWTKGDNLQTFISELKQQHYLKHTRKLKMESL